MPTKKKIRSRLTKIIRAGTGLSLPIAARVARLCVQEGTGNSDLADGVEKGIPGLVEAVDYMNGCGDPGCCGSPIRSGNAEGPRGSMDASALYRAVRAAQTATPPPPTPRTLRPRKPLACGCGRVVPQAKIDEAKRLGVGLRCAGCGARRPRFKGGALPAPKVGAPALASASYDHAACMIAWLAR